MRSEGSQRHSGIMALARRGNATKTVQSLNAGNLTELIRSKPMLPNAAYLYAVALMACLSSCGRSGDVANNPANDAGQEDSAVVGQQPSAPVSTATCPHVAVETRCKDGFCLVPAGCFIKGSPVDEPYRARYGEEQYEVTLTQSFVMQDHETTQEEWSALGFKSLAGSKLNDDGGADCTEPSCPASMMTWLEAVKFANEKSVREGLPACIELTGCTGEVGVDFLCAGYRQTTPSYYECTGYRLPTMFEFEYAKRAGTTTAFYTGAAGEGMEQCTDIAHLDDAAWYCANSQKSTQRVKQKSPNAWGLYDMMGNVSELVSSNPLLFDRDPKPATDPQSELDEAGILGMADGAYFAWPGLLRSGRLALGVPVLDGDKKPTRIGAGVALGFRLVRTVNPAEAAAWR